MPTLLTVHSLPIVAKLVVTPGARKKFQGSRARYIASKTGCRLTGVELQPDICRAGQVAGG